MPVTIRPANPADLPRMVDLLVEDARQRAAIDPALWALADNARKQVAEAVDFALESDKQPFRQLWCIAETEAALIGIAHAMMLPVPPIYAGEWGLPGLLLPDSIVAVDAPSGTLEALVEHVEAELAEAGARLLLAAALPGDAWHTCFKANGYAQVTLYLAKTGFEGAVLPVGVRPATVEDVDAIVARSAEHRARLFGLHAFWTTHRDADDRFRSWMQRSLTLVDRDMLVAGPSNALDGYIIAQPASRLHFPPAHDIEHTGTIDDYYHSDFSDPTHLEGGGKGARALLSAAETAFAGRGTNTALIVCPAAWTSKIEVLERAGYRTALTWLIKG